VSSQKLLRILHDLRAHSHLGRQTVEIVVNTDDDKNWPRSGHFTIHKLLLARYSRYFNDKFHNLMDREILSEIVMDLETHQTFPGGFDRSDAPVEYIPSFATVLRQCPQDAAPGIRPDSSDAQSEEVIELPGERSRIFRVFIHWLYTQELPSKARGFSVDSTTNLATLYALAERLQVPLLRRQCYRKIYELYQTYNSVPEPAEALIVMDNSLKTSLLRKFYVSKAAHAVIKNTKEQKEAVGDVLIAHPNFAREVSDEIMSRLRADDKSTNPIMDSTYETDDSDSDFESSEDGYEDNEEEEGLRSEPDSADWMSLSGEEDNDSLAAETEAAENGHVRAPAGDQESEQPKTEGSDVDTNNDASFHPLLPNPPSEPYTRSVEDEGSQDERDSTPTQDSEAERIAGSNEKHLFRTKARDTQNTLSEPALANDSRAWVLQDLPPSALNPKLRAESTLSTSSALKVSQHTAQTNMQASSSTAPPPNGIGVKRKRADGMDDDRGQTPPSKIHIIDLST
jgi:BTB/POZ domain